MEPKIVSMPGFTVAGMAVRTTNEAEKSGDGKIPQLWKTYGEERIWETIPHQIGSEYTYGVYSDYENGADGLYNMMVGVEVNDLEQLPDHLTGSAIPAASYAVFTSNVGPLSQIVPELWQHIWQWFAASSVKRSFTYDFERYDARSANPGQAQMEIYIAIREETL